MKARVNPIFHARRGLGLTNLINTPLQRGACRSPGAANRFNGFHLVRETVETVHATGTGLGTPLKRGVNESRLPWSARECAMSWLIYINAASTTKYAKYTKANRRALRVATNSFSSRSSDLAGGLEIVPPGPPFRVFRVFRGSPLNGYG